MRSWPDPRGRAGLDAARADLAHAVELLLGPATENDAGPIEVETFVDCRYAGQSHELTVRAPEEFPAEHARRNGYAREGAPIEVVAVRARASRHAPLTLGGAASTGACACDRPARGRRAGLHGVGTRWVGRGAGADGCMGAGTGGAAGEPRSGVVADPDLTAGWDRRRDGRGAAPRRVQPEHQGARRLLGRALHGRRRAARAGRAHPRAPRFDARVGRGGDRRDHGRGDRLGPATRRRDRGERSVRGRHAPQRHHVGRAVLRRERAGGVGREPCAPRRRRWHRAGVDASRRDRHCRRGAPHRADAARRPRWSS